MKKILSVLGTRPEIVKFSPLFDLFETDFENIVVHTGQHYDYEMDSIFFEELGLDEPHYNLSIGSCNSSEQVSKIIHSVGTIIEKEDPDMVLVLGDTNSTLGGAIAAKTTGSVLGHIEAGCRSFNRQMPEEINRIITDSVSDYLFVPDEVAMKNLENEGMKGEKVILVGSTSLEASKRNQELTRKVDLPESLFNVKEKYVLVTIHRAETTNNRKSLTEIIRALNYLSEHITIFFPIHPGTKKKINEYNIELNNEIIISPPLGYLQFLKTMKNAHFIITDSGGIQEESAVVNVPCFISRKETEWMYLVHAKKNFLVGTTYNELIENILPAIKDEKIISRIKERTIKLNTEISTTILENLKLILD